MVLFVHSWHGVLFLKGKLLLHPSVLVLYGFHLFLKSKNEKITMRQHCKGKLAPGEYIHDGCIEPYAESQQAKADRKREKQIKAAGRVERAEDRSKKEDMKTIPQLIKEAQTAFNAFIRERDYEKPCICCGLPLGAGEVGGAFDCGHYRSTGSASHLRFDERNAHAQRKVCNRWGAGRAVDYRVGLIARIGIEAVESLESSNVPHKWRAEELRAIRDDYRARAAKMKKDRQNA